MQEPRTATADRPAIDPATAAALVHPATYADWDGLHAIYSRLRATAPLAVAHPPGYDPFWVVTRHEDIRTIGKSPAMFLNTDVRPTLMSRAVLDRAAEKPVELRTVVSMDGAEHAAYRKLTFADLAPKGVKALGDDIRALARRTVDDMLACDGACDFVGDVALRYPLRVMMKLLGLPAADEDMMLRMTEQFFNPHEADPQAVGARAENEGTSADHNAMRAALAYLHGITADRRATPRDDLASAIANGRVGGELIPAMAAASYYFAIMTAGHDTTSSSIAGAVWALAERPDQYARLRAEPGLAATLADEAVRWTSPVVHFMRSAADDAVVGGETIRAGDWLMLCYPSANRDEAVFDAPFEFRLDRAPAAHLGFGFGPHNCLGQHLAKLEMRIFFEELALAVESIALAGRPTRAASLFVNGVRSLPLSFTAAMR